ncbi:MAG TPA: SRPBCC domain-containing protein [Kofleriaceae bacterium]|nr:SRPBCC domain-containing protein [Kofleriaceae bacterium]
MIEGDRATVTVLVDVEPAVAFEVFTAEIDQWWRHGVAYRAAGRNPGKVMFECKLGGRLLEQYDGPAGPAIYEAGRITAWEPPARLAFEWRGGNFAPGEITLVEVTFTRAESGRTQVVLVHSGFAALRPDHPVRHGEPPAQFIGRVGQWWGKLLTSLREHASDRT